MDRRSFIAAAAAGVAACPTPASAQDAWPSRPVTVINPFPPGGNADVVGRPFAAALEGALKQPVVVETRQGAGGQVGTLAAHAAKPDGYTLCLHLPSLAAFPEIDRLYGRTAKFARQEFVPIVRLTAGPMVLIVNDQQPWRTLQELVEDARKRPRELIFSSSGLHGALHLPTAMFLKAAGLEMKHLPTNGGGPSLTALIGNNSQMAMSGLSSAAGQVKGGKARILATLSAKRVASIPDVPTLKELGYDVEFYLWVGLFAPNGTPQTVVDRLRGEARKAVAAETFVKAMGNVGEEIAFLDQPEFREFWEVDSRRVEDAVRLIGKV